MSVSNVHERAVDLTPEHAGALLDSLASPEDRLWPAHRWPTMRLDPGLAEGAHGGHGPIRYVVTAYDPGRAVRFRFENMGGLEGEHWFEITPVDHGRTVLRHSMTVTPGGKWRLMWPLAFRWLHDALLEDLLDRAEGVAPRPLPLHVRALRRAVAPRRRRLIGRRAIA